ncbi:hypothetical protein D1AOALGA4SA_3076 [Olavius algarvensis Delta 1 endosymbiont]|nr:hypothetical protein D1AOALGA4SA_3076 [Olavius algarvensis Delta 1 endosymbiont]
MNTNKDIPDNQALERFRSLRDKRQHLMTLAPRDAMERILQDPQSLPLVHSFPEQDFYFLIHDIGPEDAGPLLALASNRQWEHLVDLETWHKDQIDSRAVSRWLDLLLKADPSRFLNWFLNEKLEFVEFFLYQNIEVRVREHDQDPADLGKGFFSLDNTYFIRFIDQPAGAAGDEIAEAQRKKFITRLAETLSDLDHRTYQGVLLEATHVIPAETEEDCYRWRNVRLADKGFLPFDEAIGIYQPLKARDLAAQSAKIIPPADDPTSFSPVPQYPSRLLKEDDPLSRALAVIDSENVLGHIQTEFANLCNQIIVADHKTIRERDQLRDIVKKACGYVSIGLQRLSETGVKLDRRQAATLVTRHPLTQIFRVGFGEALKLKWRAEKWLDQCWYARHGLRLTFWGEQWLGVLGGLLIKKPLFYDNYKTGVLYREFESLADVDSTEDAFSQIKAVDDLLSLMSIDIEQPSAYGFLTYKNLILTLWARHFLKLSAEKLKAINPNEFKPFFEQLLPEMPGSGRTQKRKIPQEMKQNFLDWLAACSRLIELEITQRVGPTLEDLFEEIENEMDRVTGKDLDPRYVQLFLLEQG